MFECNTKRHREEYNKFLFKHAMRCVVLHTTWTSLNRITCATRHILWTLPYSACMAHKSWHDCIVHSRDELSIRSLVPKSVQDGCFTGPTAGHYELPASMKNTYKVTVMWWPCDDHVTVLLVITDGIQNWLELNYAWTSYCELFR